MPKVERIVTSPLSTSRQESVDLGGRGTFASCLAPITNQRGQSLIELGIIVVLFALLSMGMIEFGRAFMVANMITHAARDGARAAAVAGPRDASGAYLDYGAVQTAVDALVKEEIKSVLDAATVDSWPPVDLPPPPLNDPASGLPIVQVTINGTVPYIFNLVGSGFAVARTVTFRDEGR